jgi:hypothetical protein
VPAVLGELVKRPTVRLTVATLGVLAVGTVAVVVLTASSADGRFVAEGTAWVVPLVAGCGVGLVSWLLLAGTGSGSDSSTRRISVRCVSCGAEILEDWRLCPYCGGSNESLPAKRDAASA